MPFIVIVVTLLKIVPGDYSGKLVFDVVFEEGKAAVVMDITFTWSVQIYIKFQSKSVVGVHMGNTPLLLHL